MLKRLSICVALVTSCAGFVAIAMESASAQQQEAVLQAIEVPGAAFDLIIAMPKVHAATIDLAMSPEALVVHLMGDRLALAFVDGAEMLKTLDSLRHPVGTFDVQDRNGNSQIPLAVYVAPRGNMLASAEK